MRQPDLTKKKDLIEVLKSMGCRKLQSKKHEWWINLHTNSRQAVPHGRKIDKHLAENIIKKLSNNPQA